MFLWMICEEQKKNLNLNDSPLWKKKLDNERLVLEWESIIIKPP